MFRKCVKPILIKRVFYQTAHKHTKIVNRVNEIFKKFQVSFDDKNVILGIIDYRPIEGYDTFTPIRYHAIGSRVLFLCVADYLYAHYPNFSYEQSKGALFQFCKKSNLVKVATSLNLSSIVKEGDSNASKSEIDDYLSSTFVRLLGAMYEIYGLYEVRRFIVKEILQKSVDITHFLESFDPVRELNDLLKLNKTHKYFGEIPVFATRETKNGEYISEVLIKENVIGTGRGQTKKLAEMRAAQDALNRYYTEFNNEDTPIQKAEKLEFSQINAEEMNEEDSL